MNIAHPNKILVSAERAAAWRADEFLIQRKYDGEFCTDLVLPTKHGKTTFLAERVTAKSGAFLTASDLALLGRAGTPVPAAGAHGVTRPTFYAVFTIAAIEGVSVLHRPWWERWEMTKETFNIQHSTFNAQGAPVILAETVPQLSTINYQLGAAEGMVAHRWTDGWGMFEAWKQSTMQLCRVTATGSTQSVEIVAADTGRPLGSVRLGGGKCDRVRVGSLIRVEALGIHASGKLRQPVPCREWLVQP